MRWQQGRRSRNVEDRRGQKVGKAEATQDLPAAASRRLSIVGGPSYPYGECSGRPLRALPHVFQTADERSCNSRNLPGIS